MIRPGDVPDAPLDPPDEPELPEAEGKCPDCGKENWGTVEQDGDTAKAQCLEDIKCAVCDGLGKAAKSSEEQVALVLMGDDKCPECRGLTTNRCQGQWTLDLSPPEPDERDED